jgi:GT2 family glycosyltransferase
MFSILIPTFNNLEYLKICINSLKKNSKFNHQIIVHVNEGNDGTLDYIKDSNLEFTFSDQNIGMPKALNKASNKAKFDYIVISHDDFYYCPEWDLVFKDEIDLLKNKKFYLSGTMIGHTISKSKRFSPPIIDAGKTFETFDEEKLLKNLDKIKTFDWQGSTKCPGLVTKELWESVGGWSENFFPTGGDDTDFAKKLWDQKVRVFKGLGKCSIYHFGSITTRKKPKTINTYLGSKANKIFLNKWGMTINFFEKFYLKAGLDKNKDQVFERFRGILNDPNIDLNFIIENFINKMKFIYQKIVNFK